VLHAPAVQPAALPIAWKRSLHAAAATGALGNLTPDLRLAVHLSYATFAVITQQAIANCGLQHRYTRSPSDGTDAASQDCNPASYHMQLLWNRNRDCAGDVVHGAPRGRLTSLTAWSPALVSWRERSTATPAKIRHPSDYDTGIKSPEEVPNGAHPTPASTCGHNSTIKARLSTAFNTSRYPLHLPTVVHEAEASSTLGFVHDTGCSTQMTIYDRYTPNVMQLPRFVHHHPPVSPNYRSSHAASSRPACPSFPARPRSRLASSARWARRCVPHPVLQEPSVGA
jgi:hypothetical protein